jgi:hypothetical protein
MKLILTKGNKRGDVVLHDDSRIQVSFAVIVVNMLCEIFMAADKLTIDFSGTMYTAKMLQHTKHEVYYIVAKHVFYPITLCKTGIKRLFGEIPKQISFSVDRS